MTRNRQASPRQARIYFADGHVERFRDQKLAFALWLALPKGVKAAFRGADDRRPVYPWDYVDAP
jgi:prepilin-type processing-associated H-X9-DG protein